MRARIAVAVAVAALAAACFHAYEGPPPEPGPPPAPVAATTPAPPPEPAQEPDAGPPPPAPVTHGSPRRLTLRVLADDAVAADPRWRDRVNDAVAAVNEIFAPLAIAFEVADAGTWKRAKGEDDLDSLIDRVENERKGKADIVVAFAGGLTLVPQTVDHLGIARYPGDVAVVRWTEPPALARVLGHELAHLFGAVHIDQPGSLMRPEADGKPGALDAYNQPIVDANRDRGFASDKPPLTAEQADRAIAAVQRVLRDDHFNRDASDMDTLLREYKIHLKAWRK